MKKHQKASFIIGLFIASGSYACAEVNHNQRGEPRKPPIEALKACETKQAGDTCQFTGQRGNESGTCFTPQSNLPLACKPANAPKFDQQSKASAQ